MADPAFNGFSQLSEAFIMAFRNEDRVIAKAFGAGGLACDSAIADAVIESAMAIGIDQAQDTTKTSGALPIGYVFHLFQQFFQILLVIGADSGKTGGIDARLSIKRIDFQARVVSEHPALFRGDGSQGHRF